MNPWGLLVIGLGIILIYIGWKGSQHTVVDAFKGIRPNSNVHIKPGQGSGPPAPLLRPGPAGGSQGAAMPGATNQKGQLIV